MKFTSMSLKLTVELSILQFIFKNGGIKMAEEVKATRSLGTKLMKGTTAIAGLTSIGGIEITADTTDVTTLDSEGGYREFIGTFKDGGEVPIEGFLIPTLQVDR